MKILVLHRLCKTMRPACAPCRSVSLKRPRACLQKAVTGASKELADRVSVHLNTCNQNLERSTNQFKSPEEHYDYAVSLMNVGDYVTAREHLEKLSKQVPKADYVAYGLAALDCLTGHLEDSLAPSRFRDSHKCGASLPGPQRFRFSKPGRGSPLYRTSVSRPGG